MAGLLSAAIRIAGQRSIVRMGRVIPASEAKIASRMTHMGVDDAVQSAQSMSFRAKNPTNHVALGTDATMDGSLGLFNSSVPDEFILNEQSIRRRLAESIADHEGTHLVTAGLNKENVFEQAYKSIVSDHMDVKRLAEVYGDRGSMSEIHARMSQLRHIVSPDDPWRILSNREVLDGIGKYWRSLDDFAKDQAGKGIFEPILAGIKMRTPDISKPDAYKKIASMLNRTFALSVGTRAFMEGIDGED